MGHIVEWDKIPDISLVPSGDYLISIEDIEETTSREASKVMFNACYRIMEPAAFENMPIYDTFVIGSNDDPGAQYQETWEKSFGAKRMNQLGKAAQVPLDRDTDVVIAALRGQQVVATVEEETDTNEFMPDGVTPNKYKGNKRNRVRGYYPIGSRIPQVTEQAPSVPSGPIRRAAPRTATAPPAAQPAGPTAVPPRTSVRRAPPAARTTTPPSAKPPARPAAKKVQQVQCDECKENFGRLEFSNPEIHPCAANWQA